ncbi:SPFH domain-containing protein [Rhodococcus rhodochrous]|uniref:SPFH domain-containing protein n=1 Tax=Rhodococcus rhodochrous TaxID=1829 RepID=UPI00177C3BE2|nr:SPFH domain-containing protein [Rhodococcus rhodochrous]
MNRKTATALIAFPAVLILTGCSISTSPDEAGLIYDAGPLSKTSFQECVAPSARVFYGPADQSFTYPAGQRTYVFGTGEESDIATITVADRDGIDLGVVGQLRFTLNTDCDTLVQFHEKIGLKYEGGQDWPGILAVYLQQPLRKAITEATQGMTWRELYQDPAAKATWEKRVKDTLPAAIEQATGGEYFTNIDLSLQKPVLPKELTDQLLATQRAAEAAIAQEEENRRLELKAQGERALIDLYGADNYVVLKAIEDGKIQILPVPQGAIINLPAGDR